MSALNSGSDAKTQVLRAIDVVELIGQSVKLKRRGKDYVGLCPFHQEKTPSFHVKPDKQFFICYGCKAAGNAIDFIIRRDRVEFIEALKLLAKQAGIELPRLGISKQQSGERQTLLDANSAAVTLFEKLLSHPQQGRAARDYLRKRGFTDESIKRFRIGYAANSWDTLLSSDLMKKFPPTVLQLAGLVKARETGGHYDTFRNRVMFPIRDESGRVIAFGGRIMPGSEDPAKYLNSPETPLFSKSRSIFGIDLAKQRIVETRTAAVVEGYTDVIMAHQCGASNVVSILGTAMTDQHVAILRRFADRVVLLFDADTAGDAAVDRSVELFLTQPIEIAIASMPPGVDPDEYLLQNGTEAFESLLANAQDALTYKWKQLVARFNAESGLTGQQKAVEEYLELLAGARGAGPVDAIRWGSSLARVSRLTEIPAQELNRRFKVARPRGRSTPTATPKSRDTTPEPARRETADDRAERWIMAVLLVEPQRWHDVQQHLSPQDFTSPLRARLAELYWQHQRDEGEPQFNEFLGMLDDPELVRVASELADEAESLEAELTLADAVEHLRQARRRKNELELTARLRRKSAETSEIDEIEHLKKLQEEMRQPDLWRLRASSGS